MSLKSFQQENVEKLFIRITTRSPELKQVGYFPISLKGHSTTRHYEAS